MPIKLLILCALLVTLTACNTMSPARSARLTQEGSASIDTGVTLDMKGGFEHVQGKAAYTGTTITPQYTSTMDVKPGMTLSQYFGVSWGLGPSWDVRLQGFFGWWLNDLGLGLQLRRALIRDLSEKGFALTASVEGRYNFYVTQAVAGLTATQRLGSKVDLTLGGRGGWMEVQHAYFVEGSPSVYPTHRGTYAEVFVAPEFLTEGTAIGLGTTLRWYDAHFIEGTGTAYQG